VAWEEIGEFAMPPTNDTTERIAVLEERAEKIEKSFEDHSKFRELLIRVDTKLESIVQMIQGSGSHDVGALHRIDALEKKSAHHDGIIAAIIFLWTPFWAVLGWLAHAFWPPK
jgi:hypothetical protein